MISVGVSRITRGISRNIDLILIWLFIFSVYIANFRSISSGDALPASILPFSILEYHNLYFDQLLRTFQYVMPGTAPYMFTERSGHYLSIFPVVLPVLITPLYVIPYMILKLLNYPMGIQNQGFYIIVVCMEKLAASIIASLSAVFVYLFLRELASRRTALITTLIYAFATSTWVISSQGLWQHGLIELLLSAMIYLVFLNEKIGSRNNIMCIGALSGLLFFARPADVFILMPILTYIVQLGKKNAIIYSFGVIVTGAPFLTYNVFFFGSIIGGYIQNAPLFSITHIIFFNLIGLLISPNRGLLIYTPIIILSIFGLIQAKGIANRRIHRFFYISGISILLQTLVYSTFIYWWAGWSYGPRYLTDILPLLTLNLGLFIHNHNDYPRPGLMRKLSTLVIVVLLIWSISVQAIGAFCFNYQWDADPSPGNSNSPDRYWNFTDTQIMRAVHSGPIIVNPMASISTVFTLRKDIIQNPSNQSIEVYLKDDSGWYSLENWNGVPTRWITGDACLYIYSRTNTTARMSFKVLSFNPTKPLEIYVNNILQTKTKVPGSFDNISAAIRLHKGKNLLMFHLLGGCTRPCDALGSNSKDCRCLGLAVQNIFVTLP